MPDSTSLSLNHLPLEILQDILHYLDIPDILRIRKVSRYLNGVSLGRDVWSDAYRTVEFISPPGPFLSQSALDLENALVSSFRVNHNLVHGGGDTQTERSTLKVREIRYTGLDFRVKLVLGRFLFIAFKEEVRCYDLNLDASDSNSGASIIYRATDGDLQWFDCVSAIDVEGRSFACAVLKEATEKGRVRISIFSLNVREQSEVTLDLLRQFEYFSFYVGSVDLGPRVIVVQGDSMGFDDVWHHIALDVHTCTQLVFSPFLSGSSRELPDMDTVDEFTSPTSISTSTHVLIATSFFTRAAGWLTFFQAFALPPPDSHRHLTTPTVLNPSHCGSISGITLPDPVLLHDAVVEATTQDVLIAIRVQAFEASRPRSPLLKHGVLRLSAAHASSDHQVGTITFHLLGPFGRSRATFLHPSFNGTGRAFYTLEPGSYGIVSAFEYDLRGADARSGKRDDGDGDGDSALEQHGARVVEYPCILRFPTPRTLLDYDPYSGRICLRSAMARYSVVEILDLAV